MKRNHQISLVFAILIVLAGSVFVLHPLIRPGFFVSDDGGWMIVRLSAFYQSLSEGQFPVRFLGRLNDSYGYPVANFLYPGFMYLGSVIHLLGVPFVDTVKIIFAGSVVGAAIFTFLWLRTYFSVFPSVIGALGFMFAPYVAYDVYHRGSVGEVFAFAWAAMGLYSITAKKPWLFAPAVAALILSHNSIALLFVGFYVAYITVRKNWKDFFFMFVLGIGMATFFWFPALYEQKYIVFDATLIANFREYFITPQNWTLIGVPGIIAAAGALMIRKPRVKDFRFFLTFFFLTVFFVLPVAGFVWNMPILARLIQFPYRVLSLSVFVSAWLISYVLANLKKPAQIIIACLFTGIGLWTTIFYISNIEYSAEPEGYYTTNEGTTTVKDEYMPRWVVRKPGVRASNRIMFYSGQGEIEEKVVTTQTIDVVVHALESSVVQINTVYYPGWGATLDNEPVSIQYKNDQGLIRISVPPGDHRLIASFRETISRFVADGVSLAFLVWYMVTIVRHKRKK
ncbi:hypothetical protein A2363_03015 [Candidatus Gottesmanbacteria bacterium RIFOXYB1_FULL_47_11]|uniref:Membrane protein 6-pyruvoyl-tetrahydropterin synthase-related domain-containing protein n=1 Tax=Candidatus Gottesmanbacteria bacterium RIFOXYB1_FULL_47_11 TaxID=1798401 RepID=A0A1F6BFN3_9BACT|nr:MAG: hypothetical protein A2363_03015 [Candidatus Gottesmanbacteria bacterium RIFOXYB1_FULL_47_11]